MEILNVLEDSLKILLIRISLLYEITSITFFQLIIVTIIILQIYQSTWYYQKNNDLKVDWYSNPERSHFLRMYINVKSIHKRTANPYLYT